jgi:hypothetical protein
MLTLKVTFVLGSALAQSEQLSQQTNGKVSLSLFAKRYLFVYPDLVVVQDEPSFKISKILQQWIPISITSKSISNRGTRVLIRILIQTFTT